MSENIEVCDEKITLWTSQNSIVIDTINTTGVYHVKKEFITKKYGEVSNVFLEPYNWFIKKAEKIVPKPPGAEYPIWLFTDLKYVDHHPGCYILEIKVSKKESILFDREKWNRILNLSYIPENERDRKNHENLLEKQGIHDETNIYMTNYYPHLKSKVKKSWDRLFENRIGSSPYKQAALWEIRKESIVSLI
ncbi:DUF3841 domain-containing protein [Clostridium formicaceticum]|uniref:DUF3841 domain-containing protein n=1 Tax=Clostridium formicaceticum TaxID=1497 RepID=A0AAC9RP80_9CLOT|nr:DUF3841 domain-containing protein [Clostridium formicaceticum]AOY78150.1 hypothetical protein BJL90_21165 [Clostridium formicaceticum]ARE88803.1 hypothetical protein CLFO_32090 [Clostridium formicaceticum]